MATAKPQAIGPSSSEPSVISCSEKWIYVALLVASVAATVCGVGFGLFGGGAIPGIIANAGDAASIVMGGAAVIGVALTILSIYQLSRPSLLSTPHSPPASDAPRGKVESSASLAKPLPELERGPFTHEELLSLQKLNEHPNREDLTPPFVPDGFWKDRGRIYQVSIHHYNCLFHSAIAGWIHREYEHINLDHPYVKYVIYEAAMREREFCADWLRDNLERLEQNDIFQLMNLAVDGKPSPPVWTLEATKGICLEYIEKIRKPKAMCAQSTVLALSRRWNCEIIIFNDLESGEWSGSLNLKEKPITLRYSRKGLHYTTYLLPFEQLKELDKQNMEAYYIKMEAELSQKVMDFYTSGRNGLALGHPPRNFTLVEILDPKNEEIFLSDFNVLVYWLFPTTKGLNRGSTPSLNHAQKQEIDKRLIERSFIRTLQILGLEIKEGKIVPDRKTVRCERGFDVPMHLYRMWTLGGALQIIQSLREFERRDLSERFEDYLQSLPNYCDQLASSLKGDQKAFIEDKKKIFEKFLGDKERDLALLSPSPDVPAQAAAARI